MAPTSIPNDIYQYSLRAAYNAGLTEGGPPVAFLTHHGTHGIGIFEAEEDDDGTELPAKDMVQIDSIAYAIDSDGDVERADKDDTMPFTMVTVFQAKERSKMPKGMTHKKVLEMFSGKAANTPVPFKITGPFSYISTTQATHWEIKGTIFGFFVPAWQKEVSGEGLQSRFLSQDRKQGGVVRDFETADGAVLEWAKCGRFHLGFPQDEEYEQLRI